MSALDELFEKTRLGPVKSRRPLSGGCVGEVEEITTAHGRYVVKRDRSGAGPLAAEGRMLRYLADHTDLPVPKVLRTDATWLVMTFVPGETGARGPAEDHAADLLAALHGHTHPSFGFGFPTVIGGLWQNNDKQAHWPTFYLRQRVMDMAGQAHDAGQLPDALFQRLAGAEATLTALLPDDVPPALIHGDVWSGNVLSAGGRVTAFIDPAISFCHAEMELAFITMFSTFGDRFFARYAEQRPLSDGFWDTLRPLYLLYPLLVHVRLFGGGYVHQVSATLDRFGV